MNLSKTSKYVIRILCYMASDEKQMYTAKHLVETLDLSDKFIRKLMTQLSKAQLIRSIQGREGGYVFAKPIQQIYLMDIVRAVEDPQKYIECALGFKECSDKSPCPIHDIWKEARKPMLQMLTRTSLKEIVDKGFDGKF